MNEESDTSFKKLLDIKNLPQPISLEIFKNLDIKYGLDPIDVLVLSSSANIEYEEDVIQHLANDLLIELAVITDNMTFIRECEKRLLKIDVFNHKSAEIFPPKKLLKSFIAVIVNINPQ